MSIGAIATKDDIVGGQRKTDGLWKHYGIFDVGSVRASDNLTYTMQTGAGLELLYDKPSRVAYIMSYGRETPNFWGDLTVNARNITLAPQGGSLTLPANCVGTSQIQANAVQQLVGSYQQQVSWTIPAGGTWTETPIQINTTLSGATLRIEFNFLIACPTKGTRSYWGFMLDGAIAVGSLGAVDAPEANYGCMAVGQYYWTTAPSGAHRISMALYAAAGTSLVNEIYSTLYLTEQKR